MTFINRTRLAAPALALLLSGTPLAAQEAQLADSALAGISQLGMELPAGTTVTTGEAALIENVLASTDDRTLKVARIEEILGLNAVAGGADLAQLRDSVRSDMAALGIDTSAVDLMTDDELIRIENVSGSGDDEVLKRQRIERILVEGAYTSVEPVGDPTNGLEDLVMSDLARIGMPEVDVAALSLEELTLIRGVTSSSDDAVEQRSRVERILAE